MSYALHFFASLHHQSSCVGKQTIEFLLQRGVAQIKEHLFCKDATWDTLQHSTHHTSRQASHLFHCNLHYKNSRLSAQEGLGKCYAPVFGSKSISLFGLSNVSKQVSLHDWQNPVQVAIKSPWGCSLHTQDCLKQPLMHNK